MQRESWGYGEPVVVERGGVIRRLQVEPWVAVPRQHAWQRGARITQRWVWYPVRTLQRLFAAGIILALALGGWATMTWLSLRLLGWLEVRPW